jgi:uncharacterized protein
MSLDGLATPLGAQPKAASRQDRFSLPGGTRLAMIALGIVIAGAVSLTAWRSIRASGEPMGLAPILRGEPQEASTPPLKDKRAALPPPARVQDVKIQEAPPTPSDPDAGVRISRPGGESAGAKVIKVPASMVTEPAAEAAIPEQSAPNVPATLADPRVSERGRHGILPKIGDGGLLPRTHFARAFTPNGKPMIAVVMTGVGIGSKGTADAISKLPGEVTLAFAPYGRDLDVQVQRARRDGHEIILQVPMEPLDYPESDPGPHTLRSAEGAAENEDRLQWLMSRFTGYVGLTNFMGDKLMGSASAYSPILSELARRGLLFLDDGLAKRSLTGELATRAGLPAATADRVVESGSAAPALRTTFSEIEGIAREKGRAIVTIPALPANIEMVAQWHKELAKKGLVLAPLSAIVLQPKR